MKAMLNRTAVALGVTLALACANLVIAGEPQAKTKNYKGTIIEVDRENHSLTVRGLVTTRTFNAGEDCKLALESKPDAAWSDFGVGQVVAVTYYNAHGVNVACQVAQQDLMVRGYITALNGNKQTVSVRHAGFTREFTLAKQATVMVGNGKSGSLGDLKVGDTVRVIYRTESEPLIAQSVERGAPTFNGTIRAVDARARTVTVKGFLNEKRFHLAKSCKIVVNDKLGGTLSDLRIGDRASITYENADGVLVANRIGRETPAAEPIPPTASAE